MCGAVSAPAGVGLHQGYSLSISQWPVNVELSGQGCRTLAWNRVDE